MAAPAAPPIDLQKAGRRAMAALAAFAKRGCQKLAGNNNAKQECKQLWKDGCYKYLEQLGSGAYGTAILVVDKTCDADAHDSVKVLKLIPLRYLTEVNPLKEVTILRQLKKHANIVKLYDCFVEHDFLVIAMEFCSNGDLDQRIERKRKRGDDSFETSWILDTFLQMLEAVEFIHSENVIHRDLKPSNIFLSGGIVKIGDFGVSRRLTGAGELAKTLAGTPCYMAPELLAGAKTGYNCSVDIWSLGCILYEMCTFRTAFIANDLQELQRRITAGNIPKLPSQKHGNNLAEALSLMLTRDPARRPSASALLKLTVFANVKNAVKTVLLVGCTGSGKSALGNLLSGKSNAFKVSNGIAGCTREHLMLRANLQHLVVVDTMGMSDADDPPPVVRIKISEALDATRNGVDCILFCMKMGRLTDDQYAAFDTMISMFGDECCRNLVLVLTFAKKLLKKSVEEQNRWIREQMDLTNGSGEQRKTAQNFTHIIDACQQRVIFIENPDVDEDEDDENVNIKVRKMSKNNLLATINSMNVPKYVPEAARRAMDEERKRKEEERSLIERAEKQRLEAEEQLKLKQSELEKAKADIERQKQEQLHNLKEVERLRVERAQVHEFFCKRKNCSEWKKLIRRNLGTPLTALWTLHADTCKNCQKCRMCFLENMTGRSKDEENEMRTIHDHELEKLKPNGKCSLM